MKKEPAGTAQKTALLIAAAALLMALIVSALDPYDRLTWLRK